MFTDTIDEAVLLAVARESLKLPRGHAVTLLEDNVIQDWTDVIRTGSRRQFLAPSWRLFPETRAGATFCSCKTPNASMP